MQDEAFRPDSDRKLQQEQGEGHPIGTAADVEDVVADISEPGSRRRSSTAAHGESELEKRAGEGGSGMQDEASRPGEGHPIGTASDVEDVVAGGSEPGSRRRSSTAAHGESELEKRAGEGGSGMQDASRPELQEQGEAHPIGTASDVEDLVADGSGPGSRRRSSTAAHGESELEKRAGEGGSGMQDASRPELQEKGEAHPIGTASDVEDLVAGGSEPGSRRRSSTAAHGESELEKRAGEGGSGMQDASRPELQEQGEAHPIGTASDVEDLVAGGSEPGSRRRSSTAALGESELEKRAGEGGSGMQDASRPELQEQGEGHPIGTASDVEDLVAGGSEPGSRRRSSTAAHGESELEKRAGEGGSGMQDASRPELQEQGEGHPIGTASDVEDLVAGGSEPGSRRRSSTAAHGESELEKRAGEGGSGMQDASRPELQEQGEGHPIGTASDVEDLVAGGSEPGLRRRSSTAAHGESELEKRAGEGGSGMQDEVSRPDGDRKLPKQQDRCRDSLDITSLQKQRETCGCHIPDLLGTFLVVSARTSSQGERRGQGQRSPEV